MLNQTEMPPSSGNNTHQIVLQNDKTAKIRMGVALTVLGLYLGSLIIACIHQLL